MLFDIFCYLYPIKRQGLVLKLQIMDTNVEILKRKIESFTPELIDAFTKIVDNLETVQQSAIPQFHLDEVLYRLEFHSENPKTKLDFFENMNDLEKNCA